MLKNMFLFTFQLCFPLGWLYSQANSLFLVTRWPIAALGLYHTISAANSPAEGIFISKRSRKGICLEGSRTLPSLNQFWSWEKEISWPAMSESADHPLAPSSPCGQKAVLPTWNPEHHFHHKDWRINTTEKKMSLWRAVRRKHLLLFTQLNSC